MSFKLISNRNFNNLILRGSGSAGKLFLSLFIGFILGEETLGIYGLVNSTMILSLYLIGFEFYNYSTREIIEKENVSKSVYNQTIFETIAFIVYILISYPFVIKFIPKDYVIVLYFLLITELFSQEVYRLLIALKNSVFGNITFAIRTGLWIFPIILLLYFNIITNLRLIFTIWILFNTISIGVGSFYLFKRKILNKRYFNFDLVWVIKGIKVSFPFFIATTLGVAQLHVNRYFLDFFGTKEDVGILTFFSSFTVIVYVLVYTLVVIDYYPILIESVNKSDFYQIRMQFKSRLVKVSIWGSIIPLVVIPFLYILEKNLLIQNLPLFYLLLAGAFFTNFSNYPHYLLYAYKEDRKILLATALTFGINLILNWVLIKTLNLIGAGLAFFNSQLSLFILKFLFNKKYENSIHRKQIQN